MWRRSGPIARALAFGLALVVAPATVAAKPSTSATRVAARAKSSKGAGKGGAQSIGAPNNGRLAGAVRIRNTKTLRQREGAHSWGLPQLVRLLRHAASHVARKYHGSQMIVGDLSGRTGGHLDGHSSHQSGRDADVGFYVMNSKGKPLAAKRFIAFDDAGDARDAAPGTRFDEARNWAMVEAMVKDEKANLRYLFIAGALRAKLLAYAAKKHVSKELVEKAAGVMMSAQNADLHDDHVHVRIACPPATGAHPESTHEACIEEPTAHDTAGKPADSDDKPPSGGSGPDTAPPAEPAERPDTPAGPPAGPDPGVGSAK